VRAIYSVGDAEAEVIEAQVLSTSPLAGGRSATATCPRG
jgi:trk system potassium uptake protein TrkA